MHGMFKSHPHLPSVFHMIVAINTPKRCGQRCSATSVNHPISHKTDKASGWKSRLMPSLSVAAGKLPAVYCLQCIASLCYGAAPRKCPCNAEVRTMCSMFRHYCVPVLMYRACNGSGHSSV